MKSRGTLRATLLAVTTACCGAGFAGTGGDAGTSGASNPSNASSAASAGNADLSEIVIVANRYQATDLQMKSPDAINVLSSEDLANTAVHNVAEALGLLPGVNVMNTGQSFVGGIDGASRGEGMFVSIRGMNGEYNVNLINGVTVAQGSPYSRAVQLSLMPPSGLKTVVLSATSRADMDGDAIGGTVDFRTPTAFDFSGPQGSVTVGARYESRLADYHRNKEGYNLAADIARRFGANGDLGLYASAYYDVRYYANSEFGGVMEATCCDNAWAFRVANADGTNPSNLDPAKNLELTGANVGVSSGSTERFGGNLSFDWQPDDSIAAYFRATYAHALTDQESQLSQIVGMGVLQGSAGGANPFQIGTSGLYRPDIANVSIRYWYETNPEASDLGTLQFGGDKKLGRWTVSPNVFYSWGRDNRPDHIEIDARTNQTQGGNITNNGFPYGQTSLFTYSNNGFPNYPLLTPAMTAQLNNLLGLPAFDRGELTAAYSEQFKGGAKFDVRYDVGDGLLQYVKFGGKYLHSRRLVTNRDWTVPGFDGGTFGSLPIWDGAYSPVFPGKFGWSVPKVGQSALFAYYNSAASPNDLDTCGSIYVNSYNCNTEKGTETVSAAYALAELQTGNWEIIPGIRFEHTDIRNIYWLTPHDLSGNALPGAFASNNTSYNEALPSIFVNYRPSDTSVYRAAIWTSYTRPPFIQLGAGASTQPSSSGATTIMQGNPNLKAISAINYDASGEWKIGEGGHFKVGGYFKTLQHYIYDNGSSIENTVTAGTGTIITQPTNGGSATVGGLELSARQRFLWLPAPFDGLGISGTLTREATRVHLRAQGLDADERMQNAPDWLGNAQLFYEAHGLEVGLIFNYAGSYVAQYDYVQQHGSWDDLWIRPVRRTDLHAGYRFEDGLKIDLSIANLFKDYTYWSHIGRHTLADSDIVDQGLTALLNLTYNF